MVKKRDFLFSDFLIWDLLYGMRWHHVNTKKVVNNQNARPYIPVKHSTKENMTWCHTSNISSENSIVKWNNQVEKNHLWIPPTSGVQSLVVNSIFNLRREMTSSWRVFNFWGDRNEIVIKTIACYRDYYNIWFDPGNYCVRFDNFGLQLISNMFIMHR